jgi:hypothetical protein
MTQAAGRFTTLPDEQTPASTVDRAEPWHVNRAEYSRA